MNTIIEEAEQYEFTNGKYGFIAGVNWKQERMYSEEEVYDLLEQSMKDFDIYDLHCHYSGDYRNLKEWFEQFKNK